MFILSRQFYNMKFWRTTLIQPKGKEVSNGCIKTNAPLFLLAALLQRLVLDADCYAGCVLTGRPSAKAGAIPADLLPFLSAKVE